MELAVYNLLDKQKLRAIEVSEDIFALMPRLDIIKCVIDWQRAKSRSGNHKTKTISEVSGTGRKPYPQKKSGRARHATLRAVQMRGGGTVHGPVVRSHSTDLPKKVRKLGVCHALSVKTQEDKLIIVNELKLSKVSTKEIISILNSFELKNCLFVGEDLELNFLLSARNVPSIQVLPQIGVNVYDIMKHDSLVMSAGAVKLLEERLRI